MSKSFNHNQRDRRDEITSRKATAWRKVERRQQQDREVRRELKGWQTQRSC